MQLVRKAKEVVSNTPEDGRSSELSRKRAGTKFFVNLIAIHKMYAKNVCYRHSIYISVEIYLLI